MEPFEKTYAMIKPDALKAGKAEEICQLIEVHGFTIIAKQKLQVSTRKNVWYRTLAKIGLSMPCIAPIHAV